MFSHSLKFSFIVYVLFLTSCYSSITGTDEQKCLHYHVKKANRINHQIKKHIEIKNKFVAAYDKALDLFQIPLTEQYIKTTYGIAHVIICGQNNGDPLVLLHGMNATSTMWYPNIKSLAEKHKVYAIDFILEPGKSILKKDINDTKQIVDWYFEIFDKLKLDKVNLIGASRGGWLAMNLALNDRHRVKKMILLSPAQSFVWIKLEPKVIKNILYSISPKRKKLKAVLKTMSENIDNINQVYLDEYFIASQRTEINKCLIQMHPFSIEELKSLNMPIMLLIGDEDIINNDKALSKAKKYLSNVVAKKINKAGHFLSIDQAEKVNIEMINFLYRK